LARLHDTAKSKLMTSTFVALMILLSTILLFAALWTFTQQTVLDSGVI